MIIDNEYVDFLKIFEKYQDESKFSSDKSQIFLCCIADVETKNLLIHNISGIGLSHNKNSFILETFSEFNNFILKFREKPNDNNFRNELYFIPIFENEEADKIFSLLKSTEYELNNKGFRMVLVHSQEQLQKDIASSQIYQIRTRTFFDENFLIKKHNLLINLDKELKHNQQKNKGLKL